MLLSVWGQLTIQLCVGPHSLVAPPRGLKICQRHENDPSVQHWGVISPSKTKNHDQTANTKCRKVNLYGEMGMRKSGNFFWKTRKSQTIRFFSGGSYVFYCLSGVNEMLKIGSKICPSKTPRMDLKIISSIEMTFMYTSRHSVALLRPKKG